MSAVKVLGLLLGESGLGFILAYGLTCPLFGMEMNSIIVLAAMCTAIVGFLLMVAGDALLGVN